MKILGIICARAGSKGVRNKNIKLLNGIPLICYSIRVLKKWGRVDRLICSTDSEEIQNIANDCGVETPFLRPKELATDTANKLDTLKHALTYCENQDKIKYDYIVDLQPTAPLRTVEDINNAFEKFHNSNADLILSAYKGQKNPYFNMVEVKEDGYIDICKKPVKPIYNRQDAPQVYSLNGSIYIYRRNFLLETVYIMEGNKILYEMPDYSIDIDNIIDFEFIEFILKKGIFAFDY